MSIQATKAMFDNAAEAWDSNEPRVQMVNTIADQIESTYPLNKSLNLMEFGCGTGNVAVRFARKVNQLTAVDVSDGMLEQLRAKVDQDAFENIIIHQADLSQPGSSSQLPGSYDMIYTMMTMHHVNDVDTLIINLIDLLKNNGSLFLIDLAKEDGTFHRPEEPVFHHGFEPECLAKKLTDAGMADTCYSNIYTLTRFNDDGSKRGDYPIFMLSATKQA